jgi:archaetidylinositol phosphate synthase
MSRRLSRSRKKKVAQEYLCELFYRPLAHLVVMVVLPLRVAPPLVAAAAGTTGIAGAVELARGHLILAALLVQLKTVLDNADGQLARLSGRITVFGRYLDSELDLLVNAALFAAVGWSTGRPILATAGFLALTTVLSVNYNIERLYRAERGTDAAAMPEATGRADAVLRGFYLVLYAPQDRLLERFFSQRLRGAGPKVRLAYHDRATVSILANLGMSTQLAVFGLCIALGKPLAFAWIAVAELGLVALLGLRRELAIHTIPHLKEETL